MRFIKKINGWTIPFATSEYQDESEPLWAEGTGREGALDGTFIGTKIGNFPKVIVQFPAMPNKQIARLKKECKKTNVTLEWYSTSEEKYITSEFYPGPVKSKVMYVVGDGIIMEPFNMEFAPIKKE